MNASTLKLDDLLRFMVQQEASDLHLKPMRPPLIRLNGKLLPLKFDPVPPDLIPQLTDAILNDHLKEHLEEHQAVDFGYSVPGVSRFRASVFQQRGTRSAIFRRVPFDFPTLDDWGLPPVLSEMVNLPQGLVLITGPTGSGKSSTLASLMRMIADTRLVHIVTIEDPIEFLFTDSKGAVTQREVGTDTPTFETALRNALRHDPDVIMVGEMRDETTINTVLQAAETGHLVFSTLHTNSAVQTIDRIVDSFPEGNHRQIRQQLSNVLQAVVSMKLVERQDGRGLVAAIEILRRSPRVSKLILQGNLDALDEEMENSVSYYRMQSMNQSLAATVLNGAVSVDAALAASVNPGDLDLMLRKFLFATSGQDPTEENEMAESVSDYSKILELQEIKKHYDDLQERVRMEMSEKDDEIERLKRQLSEAALEPVGANVEAEQARQENERLTKQLQSMRQEYEAKIERLNNRVRELSSGGPAKPAEPAGSEKRGFFRR